MNVFVYCKIVIEAKYKTEKKKVCKGQHLQPLPPLSERLVMREDIITLTRIWNTGKINFEEGKKRFVGVPPPSPLGDFFWAAAASRPA